MGEFLRGTVALLEPLAGPASPAAARMSSARGFALSLVFDALRGFLDRCLLELVRTQGYHIFYLLYIYLCILSLQFIHIS